MYRLKQKMKKFISAFMLTTMFVSTLVPTMAFAGDRSIDAVYLKNLSNNTQTIFTDNSEINLNSYNYGEINVLAEVTAPGNSDNCVLFNIDDSLFERSEKYVPYELFGDDAAFFEPNVLAPGNHSLTIELYASKQCTGVAQATKLINFSVIGQYADTVSQDLPAAPANIKISNYEGKVLGCGGYTNNPSIKVSWDANPVADEVEYYKYYVKDHPYTDYIFDGTERSGVIQRGDGYYEYGVSAVNDAGESEISWCGITLDTVEPTMPIDLHRVATDGVTRYECGDTTTLQTLWPTWDKYLGTDFSHYEYSSFNAPSGTQGIDEQVLVTNQFIHNWTPTTLGTYGFAVRTVDLAGNKSPWALSGETFEGSCQITYAEEVPEELEAPVISGFEDPTLSCGTITNIKHTTVNWNNVPGALSYLYQIDYPISDDTRDVWTTIKTVSEHSGALHEGIHYIKVKAYFGEGVYSDWSNTCSITADWTAPVSTIESPSDDAALSGVVEIRGSVTDANPYRYWFVVENSSGEYIDLEPNITGTIYESNSFINKLLATWDTTAFPDGYYTIKLEARDAAGNKDDATSSDWHLVLVDNTPPVVTIIGENPLTLTEGDVYTGPVCEVNDNLDIAPTWLEPQGEVDTNTPGTYFVTCSAKDVAGNIGSATQEVIVVASENNDNGNGDGGDGDGGDGTTGGDLPTGGPEEGAFVTTVATTVPVTTGSDAGEILGETDENEEGGEVASGTDEGEADSEDSSSEARSCWLLLGICWYWWLLIIGGTAVAYWYYKKRKNEKK